MNKIYALASNHPSRATKDIPSNKCILLIDNDSVCNYINKRIIENTLNIEVLIFSDPRQALEQLKNWSYSGLGPIPQLILLDLHMPQMSGWQFLKEFEKLREEIVENCSIVILSNSTHIYDIEKSKKFKVVKDFMAKPLTVQKIKELLKE